MLNGKNKCERFLLYKDTVPWAESRCLNIKLPAHSMQLIMAKNGKVGDGHRNGAVDNRAQFQHPNGHWIKRDANNGRIMDVKHDSKPFKGVRKEK